VKHTQAVLTFLISGIFILSGCGGRTTQVIRQNTVTSTPRLSIPSATAFAELTATPSLTASLMPSLTATLTATASVTATLQARRRTPSTLMLHRSNTTFDSVQFLKDFIGLLQQNKVQVITYSQITKHPEMTATQQGKLFIISIDDIYLRYPIDPSVLEMIGLLRQAGYPAVLAVITEGNYAYPETVSTLKELSNAGWEIASHTDTHRNLGVMEKTAPRYVYTEVETSVDKIDNAIGVRPVTLVLPEGQMVNDPRFIQRAGILWIVGINGGDTYDSTRKMVYLGREGPDGDAAETFRVMMGRFNP